MKFFRHGQVGKEAPGVCTDAGAHRDASAYAADFDEEFFAADGLRDLGAWTGGEAAAGQAAGSEPATGEAAPAGGGGDDWIPARFGAPIARPSKVVAVGLNYRAHAAETGSALPGEPMIFMKATSAMCGPNDDLVIPKGSECTDYEVELAVVIGKRARYVEKAAALEYVAGYTICIDYSERDWQKNRSGQFVKGKSSDTFAPMGPYLVPADQLDPSDLRLWLTVNGEMRQDSSTADMIFDVPKVVAAISGYMSLLPGDVIITGTPSGVGMGFDPPRFLRPGDVVEYGIEGIGEGRQQVVAHPDS
jgi:2-keto-4-pentenoate hydratase/2-oxohepta-3-ene-1,7-dioic acid hydratase in catechol pathway